MSKTKERIHDSNLRYKQGLGQNFIYDEDLLAALVASSEITKDDDVLEIGPGAGSMTKYLCDAAHHVLSIELDERLIPLLTAFLAERDNFTLVQGDVMTLNLADMTKDLRKPLSVVANIPYYITTPLLTMLLASPIPIRRMALMVQKEVADKVLAQPATMAGGCSAFAASSTATRIWPWMYRQSALRPCRRWTARSSSCRGGKRRRYRCRMKLTSSAWRRQRSHFAARR